MPRFKHKELLKGGKRRTAIPSGRSLRMMAKKDYNKEFIREDKKKKDTPRSYTPGKDYVHTRISRGKVPAGKETGYSRFQKKGRTSTHDTYTSVQGEEKTKDGKERYYQDTSSKKKQKSVGKNKKPKNKNFSTPQTDTHEMSGEQKSESKSIKTTGLYGDWLKKKKK